MRIVIAGGTGFLGSPLAEVYAEEGHDVRVLTRGLPPGESRHEPGTGVPGVTRVGWRPTGRAAPGRPPSTARTRSSTWPATGIADARWTPQRKACIRDSRIVPTRSLAAAIAGRGRSATSSSAPAASATTARRATSRRPRARRPADDFLAHLCEDWEAEARRAESAATRVVPLRTGVVLERGGGALPKMMRALPLLRRRTDRLRTPVHVVDPSHRLDRDGAVDRRDAGRHRPGQRDRAHARHEPRVRTRARTRAAPAEPAAGARLRAEARAGRDGGAHAAHRPARVPARAQATGFTSGIPRSISRSEGSSGSERDQLPKCPTPNCQATPRHTLRAS